MERLLDFDGPNGTFTELCPFDHGAGYVLHVLHGPNMDETVFDERRHALIRLPCADGRNFERRP